MPVIRRLATAGVLAGALIGLTAMPALAHVSVDSTNATQGGFGVITFRVPTESETASTTKLTVQLPADAPIAFVSVKPLPGWTHKETMTKLATPITNDEGEKVTEAVSTIEWTADAPGDAIKPGEYGEFSISAGPLPKADSITFKAIQAYSDGKQVAWIEQSSGATEPEHPAPVLALPPAAGSGEPGAAASATAGGHGSSVPSSQAAPAAPAGTSSTDSGNGTATTALVIGILGLLAGLVGLGVAVTSRRGRGGVQAAAPAQDAVSGAKE